METPRQGDEESRSYVLSLSVLNETRQFRGVIDIGNDFVLTGNDLGVVLDRCCAIH